jgi:Protein CHLORORESPIRATORY REDUCTION 7
MTDSLMFQEEDYVVLRAGQPEEILSAAEVLVELETILTSHSLELPTDVLKKNTIPDRAAYLLGNYCELELGPGQYLQWYAIRLEKS